jgi:hypothetical protein
MSKKVGELKEENGRQYRMIDGKKIYQMKEETESDRELNNIINRYRASGMSLANFKKNNNLK